jgi:tetratricopeptide (TPR) repeat protein
MGQGQKGPLSRNEVLDLLKGSVPPHRVAMLVGERGIGFQLTAAVETELRGAGADDEVIGAIAKANTVTQGQRAPLTQDELVQILKGKGSVPKEQAAAVVAQRGIQFKRTPETEKKLQKAGADPQVMAAITQAELARETGQANMQVTPEEGQAYQAINNELDPERVVQMVNDFEKKFPQSALLTEFYFFGANAYVQKGDIGRVIDYCDKSLKLKDDNLRSLILMASMLPQPQSVQGTPLERGKRLSQAASYANRALQLIEQLPPQSGEMEERHKKRKAGLASMVHASLGMIHLQRSSMALQGLDADELVKAQEEYKLAVALADRPNPEEYYRLGEAYVLNDKTTEAIEAFAKASELGRGTVIQTYADQRIEQLKKK